MAMWFHFPSGAPFLAILSCSQPVSNPAQGAHRVPMSTESTGVVVRSMLVEDMGTHMRP